MYCCWTAGDNEDMFSYSCFRFITHKKMTFICEPAKKNGQKPPNHTKVQYSRCFLTEHFEVNSNIILIDVNKKGKLIQ